MNNKIATYERWKYPRTQFHSDISRANAIKNAPSQKEKKIRFMKKWWAELNEDVKRETNKKRSDALKWEKSKFWKWWIKWVCETCWGETARKCSKKCSSCYHKAQIVNRDENWNRTFRAKGKCIDCNKTLSDTYRNLCVSCSRKWERSYLWKWGITPERTKIRTSIEYKLWRDAVLARDNFTCQKTWKRWGDMEVHHIKNFSHFPELRFAIDNGITLCKESHKEFHKIYWKSNNTEQQLLQFLTNYNDV